MNKVENIISVINYIEEHLSEKLTLSSIAKSVDIQNTICTDILRYRGTLHPRLCPAQAIDRSRQTACFLTGLY